MLKGSEFQEKIERVMLVYRSQWLPTVFCTILTLRFTLRFIYSKGEIRRLAIAVDILQVQHPGGDLEVAQRFKFDIFSPVD
jgi:hypothetical protein